MATIQPASVGSKIDADIAAIKADLASLKAKALSDEKTIETWLKANWPHLLEFAMLGFLVYKIL